MDGRWLRVGLVVALMPGCSVGDIENASPFGESQSVPEGSGDGGTSGSTGVVTGVSANASDPSTGTGDSLTDTGPDPTAPGTTSGSDESSSMGSWTASQTGSDGSDTTSSIACGNGMIEGDEVCDGVDLGGLTCLDVGDFVGGALACDAACAFDTGGCMVQMDPVEVCEAINLVIPDAGSAVNTVVSVPPGGTIADVTIEVDVTHTWIGDLSIDVEHGGTTVSLYDQGCGNVDDMSLQFSDAGAAIVCAASTSGAATLPVQPLSAFDGMDPGGNWTFSFQDNAAADTGSATQVCVQIAF